MTIASAFNDITEKLGGTPSNSGTIASAIDALNDVLAGSDQPAVQTIEGAVALLGEHISAGGGGGSTEYDIYCYSLDKQTSELVEMDSVICPAQWADGQWEPASSAVESAMPGTVLTPPLLWVIEYVMAAPSPDAAAFAADTTFTMPAQDVHVIVGQVV